MNTVRNSTRIVQLGKKVQDAPSTSNTRTRRPPTRPVQAPVVAQLMNTTMEPAKEEPTRTSSSIVAGNKFSSKGMSLSYIPPTIANGEIVVHF